MLKRMRPAKAGAKAVYRAVTKSDTSSSTTSAPVQALPARLKTLRPLGGKDRGGDAPRSVGPDVVQAPAKASKKGGRKPPAAVKDQSKTPAAVKPEGSEVPTVVPKKGVKNPTPVADKRPVIYRNHSVTPKQQEVICGKFPQYNIKFGKGAPHDHPLGAMERAVCEKIALEQIEARFPNASVTDIGGNANRHAANGMVHVHSCNPLYSSDDVVRRSHYGKNANFCSKSSMDCSFIPDVYLSVHSLYYLTPAQVLELVYRSKKKRLYAVVHRFDDFYGTKHDNGDFVESKYEAFVQDEALRVRMHVTGNCTSYEHDPVMWLQSTSHTEGERTICWGGRPYGDSWLYEFVAAPSTYKPTITNNVGTMSLTTSLNRNDHSGPVSGVLSPGDQNTFKPMLELLSLNTTKIHSFGSVMWLSNTTRSVLIPKGLIETVALKMVGVTRDKAGLRLCINTMRQIVKSDKMSIPASMRTDCVIYGAALAFIIRLEDEVTTFNNLCSPLYKRLYSELTGVMSLERSSLWWLPCGRDSFNATVDAYNNDRTSVPGQPFDAAKAWPNGLPGIEVERELKEIRPRAKVSGIVEEMEEDKPQFHAVCQTFSEYIPVVPYASSKNEMTCLVNRALMTVPTPESGLWSSVQLMASVATSLWPVVAETDVEKGFADWNAKFPDGKRRNHLIAWDDLKLNELCDDDFIRKLFVKRELTMKGGPEPEDFDPRAIQANADRLNVSLGPFTSLVADRLKKEWHVDQDPDRPVQIVYTAGMTAEEIGAWRAQFGDEDVTILELDESRYDSHQGVECYQLFEQLMNHLGCKNYGNAAKALTSMKSIRGWSSHDLKYMVEYTMTSGSPTTSVSNSYLNGMKTWFILVQLGYSEFKMLVHGDDSLVVIRGHLTREKKRHLEVGVLSINKRLGFNTKLKISEEWSQVEYCSSLFWPVEGGYVLGPKIGKRLPKIGFSLRKLSPGEVKGMLLGLRIEAGYIPILRTYAAHNLKLMANVVAKEYQDSRRVYKSLPVLTNVANDATDTFFFARYGVAVHEIEKEFQACLTGNLHDCISFSGLELFVAIDL